MARLEQDGKTAMLVAVNGCLAGTTAVAHMLKPEARDAVATLLPVGIEVILLSGDTRTADVIAPQLGIARVLTGVLPGGKANTIKGLQGDGKMVAMVGVGVSDAPALATADVGIALGLRSDFAKQTGGIILNKHDAREVVLAIRLSPLTLRKIKQTLFLAFYNAIGMLGLLNSIIAAALMALSSLSVIVNSALLKQARISLA